MEMKAKMENNGRDAALRRPNSAARCPYLILWFWRNFCEIIIN